MKSVDSKYGKKAKNFWAISTTLDIFMDCRGAPVQIILETFVISWFFETLAKNYARNREKFIENTELW